jgi:hypothetical protein
MKKVLLFSILLVVGLALSQMLPSRLGAAGDGFELVVRILTMVALGFIMIHVGYEFELDRKNLRAYGKDYLIAMTAAAFPWILVSAYFLFVMLPSAAWSDGRSWTEILLAGRFAAPTSAGVLFAMLAAGGLSATWLFRKARVLAIFDDLDTVLLMIPLKMLMVGLAWQLGLVVVIMTGLLVLGWWGFRKLRVPVTWPWVLGYAALIVGTSEALHAASTVADPSVPIHIEVLLPAFVLGCMMRRPAGANPHGDDAREGHQEGPESVAEQRASTIVAAVFMVLVGLSLPPLFAGGSTEGATTVTASQPTPGWGVIALHVLAITLLSNLGKMMPAFCYRREAHWRERLGLAIGMWPRGEVGAGVLVLSLGYGIGGPIVTVAMLSLALNLVLTGVFVLIVKRLLAGAPSVDAAEARDGSPVPAAA